jgi:predicted glycosyltransferase
MRRFAGAVRVWVDMSAPAHVLVLRPIIERLRAEGHEVEVTARDYAQTLALLQLHGMPHMAIGEHGGASRLRKAYRLAARSGQMLVFGRGRHFDLALAHGSNDLAIAARTLGIPEANMHDYEYAVTQHRIGCRFAKRVMFPDAVPFDRLRRFGVTPEKYFPYPGLKEEYYLYDFEPDAGALRRLGADEERVVVIVRPPPDVSLYHRKSNPLFPKVLDRLGRDEDVHAVVLPRTQAQRQFIEGLRLPSVIVPPGAVEAQSLVALADLVVSAGGTMNREAAALGTPVYTTYGGRLGGVDEALIRSGRLRPLTDSRAVELQKRTAEATPTRRDPSCLVETILGTVGASPLREEPHPVTPS